MRMRSHHRSSKNYNQAVANLASQTSCVSTDPNQILLWESEHIIKEARSMVECFLETTNSSGDVSWTYCGTKRGIALYSAKNSQIDVPCNVHAGCKLMATIDEVAECLICSKTEAMSSAFPDYKDGSVLESILYPSIERPYRYVGLKWLALNNSCTAECSDEDFVILEYIDLIEDASGEKYAFQIFQSIDLGDIAPPQGAKEAHYSRGTLPLMGYTFHTTDKPGELKMSYSCHLDHTAGMLSHVEKYLAAKTRYIELARTRREPILLCQQVIPTSEQDYCRLCEKGFYMWRRRRYNCYKCGGVVCGTCSSMQNVHVQDIGDRHLRVCSPCVQEARRIARNEALESKYINLASQTDGGLDSGHQSFSSSGSDITCRGQADSTEVLHNMLDFIQELSSTYRVISSGYKLLRICRSADLIRSLSDGLSIKKAKAVEATDKVSAGFTFSASHSPSTSIFNEAKITNSCQENSRSFSENSSEGYTRKDNIKLRTNSCDFPKSKFITVNHPDSRALNDAIARSQGLQETTATANQLAQHMRRLAHRRVQASQYEAYSAKSSANDENAVGSFRQHVLCNTMYGSSPCLSSKLNRMPSNQVSHQVLGTNEVTLKDPQNDSISCPTFSASASSTRAFSLPDIPLYKVRSVTNVLKPRQS